MLKKKRNRTEFTKKNSFLFRLKNILDDNISQNIIYWNNNGSGIVVKDKYKLCDIILPKFFKHNNYSSFIRQLNSYGFHKSKGISKEGDIFEHEKFNKESKKEEIEQLMDYYKENKKYLQFSKSNIKTDLINEENNNNESLSIYKEEDILKYLLNKNEENIKSITELKKELFELKNQNKQLVDQIETFNNNINNHNIILQEIFKQNNTNKTNINSNNKAVSNLKELFQKYLYYLKIYSPYLNINKNNNKNEYKIYKTESFNIINNNNRNNCKINNFSDNYNYLYNLNLNGNNGNFYGGYHILNHRQDINTSFVLNLLNNYSNSFSSFDCNYKNKP